jgi:hypothetical protein
MQLVHRQRVRSRSPLLDDVLARASSELAPVVGAFAYDHDIALHLAVFAEPYLSFVLDGSKTVESRFSARAIAPHGRVAEGDVILLKAVGKPIVGWCRAGTVWDYELDPSSWTEIEDRFSAPLRVQDGFWEARRAAQFATLIEVKDVNVAAPTRIDKRDRRGWVVLADRVQGRLL